MLSRVKTPINFQTHTHTRARIRLSTIETFIYAHTVDRLRCAIRDPERSVLGASVHLTLSHAHLASLEIARTLLVEVRSGN